MSQTAPSTGSEGRVSDRTWVEAKLAFISRGARYPGVERHTGLFRSSSASFLASRSALVRNAPSAFSCSCNASLMTWSVTRYCDVEKVTRGHVWRRIKHTRILGVLRAMIAKRLHCPVILGKRVLGLSLSVLQTRSIWRGFELGRKCTLNLTWKTTAHFRHYGLPRLRRHGHKRGKFIIALRGYPEN